MSENAAENLAPEASEQTEVAEAIETNEVSEGNSEAIETQEDLQDAVEEAIDSGESEEVIQEMVREFSLKVNGKTLNKKLDLNDSEAVRKELQLAAAGRQSMQEAAELKKLYAQEIDRLKNDPYAVLEELGLDADELAEMRIQQRIEEMKKSPEQIEHEKLKSELTAARKREKELEDKASKSEMSRLQEKAAVELDDEISNALEAHQSLPNSAYTVKKIADVMLWAMDNGWDDVTVADVVPTVESEIRGDVNQLMNELPDEMLEAYIGKQTVDRLRQKRLKAAKTADSVSNIKKTASVENTKKEVRQKTRIDDWMRS